MLKQDQHSSASKGCGRVPYSPHGSNSLENENIPFEKRMMMGMQNSEGREHNDQHEEQQKGIVYRRCDTHMHGWGEVLMSRGEAEAVKQWRTGGGSCHEHILALRVKDSTTFKDGSPIVSGPELLRRARPLSLARHRRRHGDAFFLLNSPVSFHVGFPSFTTWQLMWHSFYSSPLPWLSM